MPTIYSVSNPMKTNTVDTKLAVLHPATFTFALQASLSSENHVL